MTDSPGPDFQAGSKVGNIFRISNSSFSLSSRSGERAATLVELCLIMPLLLLMLVGVLDVGRGINRFFTLNRIAYEGARYAATLPGLTPGIVLEADCVPDPARPDCIPNLVSLRNRIRSLLSQSGIAEQGQATLVTGIRRSIQDSDSEFTVVDLSIAVPFKSYLRYPSIAPDKITARLTAPYLFPDRG